MWRSPLPKGILGNPHLSHMMDSNVPSIRDLRADYNTRESRLSDVPSPDKDVNILGDVWSILVLDNHNDALDLLHFQSWFVSFRNLWWHVSCWRHGLHRRSDPAKQTTTIRHHTKLECECNTRKERETYLVWERKLDMEIPPVSDTFQAGGVNDLFVEITVDASFATGTDNSFSLLPDIVDRLKCFTNFLTFLRTY